jgi:hypothetical protein
VTNIEILKVPISNYKPDEFNLDTFIDRQMSIEYFNSTIVNLKSMYNNTEGIEDIIAHISGKKGRFFIWEHFLSWFKEYFHHYIKSMYILIDDEGYIPLTWRYYIAIMSVSTMRCDYLLKVLEENFLEAGGDESWLIHGLDVVPEKLARIGRINNMIAHQPWIILPDDIKVKDIFNA